MSAFYLPCFQFGAAEESIFELKCVRTEPIRFNSIQFYLSRVFTWIDDRTLTKHESMEKTKGTCYSYHAMRYDTIRERETIDRDELSI